MTKRSRHDISSLVDRCRSGDAEAWRDLVSRISPIVFSICRSMKLSREESFDIFGQVLYILLTNLDKIRSPNKLLSYVGTATRREVYALTRRSRFLEYVGGPELEAGQAGTAPRPDELYDESKKKEQVAEAMAKLPEREYKLLRLLFFEGSDPDYERAAHELGMPVSSIGPTRQRSLEKLRRILKRSGFDFGK